MMEILGDGFSGIVGALTVLFIKGFWDKKIETHKFNLQKKFLVTEFREKNKNIIYPNIFERLSSVIDNKTPVHGYNKCNS